MMPLQRYEKYLTLQNCTLKNDQDDRFYIVHILYILKREKKNKQALFITLQN